MSTAEVVVRNPGEIEIAGRPIAPPDLAVQLMQVIAANPTAGAENLKALLDSMERVTKWQQQQEFVAAFSRLKFPPIKKTTKGQNGKYAAFDDIQKIIDPILANEGFTLTYSSGPANEKGEIPTFGLLSHVGGHSQRGEIWLPPDGVATKTGGRNMNALQGVASATSYGQRYVAKLMLGLRFIGEDKDGEMPSDSLSQEQVDNINDLIQGCGLNPEGKKKFLDFMEVGNVAEIQKAAYAPAINFLQAKHRALGAK